MCVAHFRRRRNIVNRIENAMVAKLVFLSNIFRTIDLFTVAPSVRLGDISPSVKSSLCDEEPFVTRQASCRAPPSFEGRLGFASHPFYCKPSELQATQKKQQGRFNRTPPAKPSLVLNFKTLKCLDFQGIYDSITEPSPVSFMRSTMTKESGRQNERRIN